jgi:alpha-L-fucosidase 2
MITSPFDPVKGRWHIAWPGRVSRHDLVYLTPPCDPMQGIALGNGDVGVLGWCDDTKLAFVMNKCDLWDDAPFDRFNNWKAEEEDYSTAQRHACRLFVDFGVPVFDVMYLSDFEGRLSLADASMTISASTPFGKVSARAFVDDETGVFHCTVSSDFDEDIPVHVILERWGSRTFSHWYRLVNRDARIGLDGTEAAVDGDGFITHELTMGTFAVGCAVTAHGGATVESVREHSRSIRTTITGGSAKAFDITLAVTSPTDDPVSTAKRALASFNKTGADAAFESHVKAWRLFWERSLMESGDQYRDNLWHLTMYYANASQRGKLPGRFINGLWGWSRDVQNWGFYFHWNQQQTYWPLNAAGHHDLNESYLGYRFDALPYGQEDAQALGADGAVVSDVCERRGYNSTELVNHTPVAQIALDFWRQYRFTGDRDFLVTRALPYIVEAAKFFESLFKQEDDGLYHAQGGLGYEGGVFLRDGVTEVSHAMKLFEVALTAVEKAGVNEPRAANWRTMLDSLVPLPVIHAGPAMIDREDGEWTVKRAMLKGRRTYSDEVFAAGFGIEEQRILTSFIPNDDLPAEEQDLYDVIQSLEWNQSSYTQINQDVKCHDGIFPWVEWSPVFPSGLIGLGDRDTEIFKIAVNTARLYALAGMGWDPLPIVLARLGLGDELQVVLDMWPDRWQFYCNGWGHYGSHDKMRAGSSLRFRAQLVADAGLGDIDLDDKANQFWHTSWPFRHMGMETMSVMSCAMNESLLQSHDGVIRVAPAAGRDARFTLHAVGGFVVSAEIVDGDIRWVCVESLQGNTCVIENPWESANVFVNGQATGSLSDGVSSLDTNKGDVVLISPNVESLTDWTTTQVEYEANTNYKVGASGSVTLGLPRMF